MRDESQLSRSLWTIVLTIAVVVVVLSFARRPLIGNDGAISSFSPPLTLWVTGAEADSRTAQLAAQAAGCWGHDGRSTTVGVLPGDSATAVTEFMSKTRRQPNELLLVTSSTIAAIVRDARDELLPAEVREHANEAIGMLRQASPIAVLASDPLALAVRSDSPIHYTSELVQLMRQAPLHPLFDVGDDPWLSGNLAELVRMVGLRGQIPYGVYDSSREALASLQVSDDQVLVAPRSTILGELHDHRLRELRWPGPVAPRAWVAMLGPTGLPAARVSALRSQALTLCGRSTWSGIMRRDGFTPVAPNTVHLARFVRADIAEAARLQKIVTEVMRYYD